MPLLIAAAWSEKKARSMPPRCAVGCAVLHCDVRCALLRMALTYPVGMCALRAKRRMPLPTRRFKFRAKGGNTGRPQLEVA